MVARRGRADRVPAELVGQEVSVRAVIPIWDGVRAFGRDPDLLANDSGYSSKHLTTASARISWAGFLRVMKNLGEMLDDDQIIELGSRAMDSPFLRALLLPARLMFGIDEIYKWTFGPHGPSAHLIAVNDMVVEQVAPGHVRLDIVVREGYVPSRENFLFVRGALVGLARMGGHQVSVDQTTHDDGVVFDVHLSNSDAQSTPHDGHAELEREIEARLTAESELRRSEQRYRELFENAPLPMWVFDVTTLRFLAVNRAAMRVYGYTAEELARMTIEDIRPPEDVEAVREDVTRFRDESRVWRHRKKDGSLFHVTVSAQNLTFEGRAARLVHVFDMTQRLALEEQLRQAQKMEAIGQLAGGVAHDFNNLLMVISSYTELLLRENRTGTMHSDLRAIRSAADRGADLTQKLLMFARRKLVEPKVVALGEIVDDMRVLLQPAVEPHHDIVYEIAKPYSFIRADRSSMEQIVMNLVVNARDAMPEGGRIAVAVRDCEIDVSYARVNVGVLPGPHVALVVSDDGVGMDAVTKARIFEPFFTTKEVNKGTGLGLATVLGIVQQNGGHIQVESALDQGTTFTIYFPKCAAPSTTPIVKREGATILIVEDDDVLRASARDVLEDHGFHVLTANDAASALAICASGAAIDLVLADIVLPRVSGVELARELRVQRPDLKVLWMSGYSADMLATDVNTAYLKKPFTAALLVDRVRSLL